MVSLTNGGARMASHINDRTAKSNVMKKNCDTCFWESVAMSCTHKERDSRKFDEMYEQRECWAKWGKAGKPAWMIKQKASVK